MSQQQRLRILVVDDESTDVELHKSVLEAAGYLVATAPSLRLARKALSERPHQLLLTDLRLPDGDGMALLEDAHAADPHAAAVILTGFSSVENAVTALKAGAYDFLPKPCPEERLIAAVHRAAERYELSRTLASRTGELETMNAELDRRVQDATREIFTLNEKLKRTVSDLTDVNRRQGRFLEDMAHELKNPLSVVIGYTSFLLRRPMSEWTEDELEKSLQSVTRNANHLHALIEELLDSARLAGRKMALQAESIDARQAALQAAEAWSLKAAEKDVRVETDLSTAPMTVWADANRLAQVFNNLLSNAVKFTPKGGRVVLSAYPDVRGVVFCVADSGPGIPAADAERVFERFYQVDGKHQEHVRGLGLGLSIVAGLVTLHGGRIWVESRPGDGARFCFTLPTGAPAPASSPTPEAVGQGPFGPSRS